MEFRKLVKINCIRLECGGKYGTAFLIDNNTAITARHCIEEYISNNAEIILEFLNLDQEEPVKINADIVKDNYSWEEYPVVILKIKESINLEHVLLGVLDSGPIMGEKMYTYGYPLAARDSGCFLPLEFRDENMGTQISDANWFFQADTQMSDYEGFSGSPVWFTQYVVGIALAEKSVNERAFSFDVISIDRIAELLDNYSLPYRKIDYEESIRKRQQYMSFEDVPGSTQGIEIANKYYDSDYIIKSMTLQEELYQELEEQYKIKIQSIKKLRIEGKEDEAWELIRSTVETIRKSKKPNMEVLASLYYMQAIWYLDDKADGGNAQKYYNKALECNPKIDIRVYDAKKKVHEGTCNNVLDTLGELETTALLNTYLQICVILRKTIEARKAYNESVVEPDHSTFYMMGLINILDRKYEKAIEYIDLAIDEENKVPLYWMMKGVVLYWECVPADIEATKDLLPAMLESSIVHISENDLEQIEQVTKYYEQAFNLAIQANNQNLQKFILTVWIDTLSISNKFTSEINKLVERLLEIEPFNPTAFMWKYKTGQSLSQYNYKDFEHIIKTKKENRLGSMIALINICLSKNDNENANKYLSRYKYEFKRRNVLEYWYNLKIAATDNEDLEEIKMSIDESDMDELYKRRFRGIILERQNFGTELISHATDLYEDTKQRIDLVNLVRSCDKFKVWDVMQKYSIKWYEDFNDELALISLVKALLMQHKLSECFEKIEQYEKCFKENEEIEYYKAQILKAWGNYEAALQVVAKLWEKVKSENILILNAEILYLDGQNTAMISVLKNGVTEGIRTPKVYAMLADNMKEFDKRQAKKYAKKAYDVSNNDKKVMLWCIHFLFNLGESTEAGELFRKLRIEEAQAEGINIRVVTGREIRELLNKTQEEFKKTYEAYENAEIPYLLFLQTQTNRAYADFLYEYIRDNNALQYSPIYTVYGGKQLSIESLEKFRKEIILDYSSILLMYRLQILDQVAKYYDNIWVASNLFVIINQEIDKTRYKQADILEKQLKVVEACKKVHLFYHSFQDLLSQYSSNKKIELQDLIPYVQAQKSHLVWINDSFATELFQSGIIPNEMKEAAVNTNEILYVLLQKGTITKEALKKNTSYREPTKFDKINKIMELSGKIKLLVDFHFLEILYQMDCLTQISLFCELHVFQGIFLQVEKEESYRKHLNVVKNDLIELKDKLLDLKEEKKLFHIQQEIPEEDEYDSVKELKDCIDFMIKKRCPFVCNDRMINSYFNIENQVILSIVDIINILYKENALSKEEHCELYQLLLDKSVFYIIPSNEYMKNAILMTCDANGEIEENQYLISARRYLHRVTNPTSKLLSTKLEHVLLPEAIQYFYNLQNNCAELLQWVWEQDKSKYWKQNVSNWLLNYYSEFAYFSTIHSKDTDNLQQYYIMRLADFIFNGIRKIPGNDNKEEYYKWLFNWMENFINNNPETEQKIIDSLCDVISVVNKSYIGNQDYELLCQIIMQMIIDSSRYMPFRFVKKLFENNLLKGWLEKYGYEVIRFDSDTIIEKETFWDWVQIALMAGKNRESTRIYNKCSFTFSLIEDTYHVQKILFKWKRNEENRHCLLAIEGAYFHAKDKFLRIKGVNHIEQFLPAGTKIDESKIETEISEDAISDILEKLEQSSILWERKLDYIFNIQYEDTFDLGDLFPRYITCFENICPEFHLETWNKKIKQLLLKDIEIIELLIMLPIGKPNSVCDFIGAKSLSQEEIQAINNWCEQKVEKSYNPIELLNLAYIYKSENKRGIESILFKILDIEEIFMKLYIGLLKYAWCNIKNYEEDVKLKDETVIVYSYLFASKVYDRIISLYFADQLKYNLSDLIQWFQKYVESFDVSGSSLDHIREEDIMNPTYINIFKLTYNGVLNFLVQYPSVNMDYVKLNKKMCSLIETSNWFELVLELFLTNGNRPNNLHAPYVGSLIENYQDIFQRRENIGYDNLLDFSKGDMINKIISKEKMQDTDFIILYIFSLDKIDEKWIQNIKCIINNFSVIEIDENLLGRFKCILAITERMPEDFKNVTYNRFKNEIEHIFQGDDKEKYGVILSALALLCMTINQQDPYSIYLDILEEITKNRNIEVPRKFVENYMQIRFLIEPENWERAKKIMYHFYW